MVLPGQFLERSVVVRSGPLVLDALFHRGTRGPGCLIVPPHPVLGGSMIAPPVAELAWALARAAHPTLRFEHRGVGASQGARRPMGGDPGSIPTHGRLPLEALADEAADCEAAGEQLRTSLRGEAAEAGLCGIGVSFGAAALLAALPRLTAPARPCRVDRLVLVSPPTQRFDFGALRELRIPVLAICAQVDPHGSRQDVARLLAPLGDLARVEVIPHSDASFLRGMRELGHLVVRWLAPDGGAPLADELPESVDEAHEPVAEIELPEGEGDLELDLDAE